MNRETLPAQGPVDVNVREHIGYCPVCETNRPSLPKPAEGTCAYCYNHLMRACKECAHYSNPTGGDPVCSGGNGPQYSAWFARRSEDHCGAAGIWAVFPNVEGNRRPATTDFQEGDKA